MTTILQENWKLQEAIDRVNMGREHNDVVRAQRARVNALMALPSDPAAYSLAAQALRHYSEHLRDLCPNGTQHQRARDLADVFAGVGQ